MIKISSHFIFRVSGQLILIVGWYDIDEILKAIRREKTSFGSYF